MFVLSGPAGMWAARQIWESSRLVDKKKFPHGFPTVSPPRNALYVSEIDRYGQVLLLVHRYLAQIHLVAPGGLLNDTKAAAALTGIRAVQGSPKTLWALPDLPVLSPPW